MSDYITEGWIEMKARIKNHVSRFDFEDLVEVVRCKDCRWGREACGNIECSVDLNLPPEYHGYDWFCPNGERRTDGEEIH